MDDIKKGHRARFYWTRHVHFRSYMNIKQLLNTRCNLIDPNHFLLSSVLQVLTDDTSTLHVTVHWKQLNSCLRHHLTGHWATFSTYRIWLFSHLSVPKVLFSFSIFPCRSIHVVNSLLSHSSCYFLDPRISSYSFSSSSRWTPYKFFFSLFILRTWPY